MSRRRKPQHGDPRRTPRAGVGFDFFADAGAGTDALARTLDDGTRALFVTPAIPDDAPPEVREGIARRRLVFSEGRCPCGAVLTIPENRPPGSAGIARVEHEADCPASDKALTAALRRWKEGTT